MTAMAERVIPIARQRAPALTLPTPQGTPLAPQGLLHDALQRPLRDLRISVTDRCNFRCGYCMPKAVFDAQYRYLPQADLLRFEEITRLARLFLQHGVQKIRLTGGEPLLRKGLEHLIEQLAQLRTVQGRAPDLTLTTNGALLARKARALHAAGLQRVTVSLDSLDDAIFRRMSDADLCVTQVLDGIAAAQAAGLQRIKVNMVVQRGTNDHQIVPMARHFRGTGIALRFIEYMDVGSSNGWRMEQVLPSAEVLARLQAELALVPLPAQAEGETAQRWGWANAHGHHDPALGEIGLISSVTQAFCGSCNRARLSTQGRLYLCLFATQGWDLRQLLRSQASDADIAHALAAVWHTRTDRYSQLRATAPGTAPSAHGQRIEMSYIGG